MGTNQMLREQGKKTGDVPVALLNGSWRFIDTGVNNASLNMAIDEAILNAHLQGAVPPTLRVYRWQHPTLSLGFLQSLEKSVDLKKCDELGVEVVRRLTGGRAVLHHHELTYSIVVSEKYGIPPSIARSYALLCEGLIAAYGSLGIEVLLAAGENDGSSNACFSNAGTADMILQGRKIAGSAQFRRDDTLLQHGSLPTGHDSETLFSIIKLPSRVHREDAVAAFDQKVISASEALGREIGWQELQEAVFKGFQVALGITIKPDVLTSEEIHLSRNLAMKKYGSNEWTQHGTFKE